MTQALPSSSFCELIFQPLGTNLSPFTKLDSGVLGRIVKFSFFCPVFGTSNLLEVIFGSLLFTVGSQLLACRFVIFILQGPLCSQLNLNLSRGHFKVLSPTQFCCYWKGWEGFRDADLIPFHFLFSDFLEKCGRQLDVCDKDKLTKVKSKPYTWH